MGKAWADVPFGGEAGVTQNGDSLMKRRRGDDGVGVSMDEQNGRAGDGFGLEVLGSRKQAGIADDAGERLPAARANMKCHHGSLAETDESERSSRNAVTGKFAIEKSVDSRRC